VVQVVADGSDANSSNMALGYARGLIAGYAEQLVAARAPAAAAGGSLRADVRVWFNPQLESRIFMVPGVFALVLLVVTTMLTSMAIVREKELGTLEQLNVTPLARWELVAGKLLPYAAIGLVDILLVIAVAIYWFEVPARGSLALLFALSLLYVLNTLALGLLVSTLSKTQQQAMMTAAFFVMMPMIYLSGFIFPIENMPAAIQPVTYLIPVRYYLVIVRGILLKGVGWDVLYPQAAALFVLGLAILAFAVVRSRKTVG
jgi:ABC-2 type transport system permease protein